MPAAGRPRGRPASAARGTRRAMRFRRRSSVFPRAAWPNGLERTEPLKGQLWTRSEKALKEPDVHWSRRAAAGAVALLGSVLLAWLALGPALAIRDIVVTGAEHLTAAEVVAAAGIDRNGSILAVDPV